MSNKRKPTGAPRAGAKNRKTSAPTPKGNRTLVLRAVAVVVAVVLAAGVGWLFWSEGEQPKPPTNLSELARADGTLNVVEDGRLVMTPFAPVDGKTQVEFRIPEKYRKNFDMAHLRSHSAVGLPTRVYYLQQGGEYLAVYKADAPANGTQQSPAP
ncbi:hypothetical protein AB0M43_21555 [Longispora sp. NPDC051575]|uniref:hypothetical protein n=1 Tax=Longispora sp. NPDC051575 TaxID=3154943 RepID=UPI0034131832